MRISSFAYKGLKKLYLEDNAQSLPTESAGKIRAMLTFLQDMREAEELRAFPSWRAHQLTGNRKGVWSLHVTRNWRLTFRIQEGEIVEIDYEDYH